MLILRLDWLLTSASEALMGAEARVSDGGAEPVGSGRAMKWFMVCTVVSFTAMSCWLMGARGGLSDGSCIVPFACLHKTAPLGL